MSNYVKLF